uniref:Diacylglycerol kinase n=1 Tax=Oncorhynchus tshawytscha TaxID=74940 RepID=A0AAZ3PB14_ONCTS
MASKLNPNVLYVQELRESTSSQESDRLAPPEPGEESSDSDGETDETEQKLIRKVSTSGQLRAKKSVKEGILLKQTSSFQRWKRRYFKLRGRTLYYAKDSKSLIFDEVDLSDASVAETSTKNINNSFTVITPFRKLMLCAESRKEMEDWIGALKSVQKWEMYEASLFNMEHFSGMHNWYACSHARPTFCNVCREALSGVTSHGLSCEVTHTYPQRCAVRSTNTCKWTTLASIGNDIMEDDEGVSMPHQWLEGNLPVSAKCVVCDKNCGSVRRLQDWRCLWCKAIVHSSCKEQMGKACPLGQCRVSIIPPTTLNSIDSDGFWKATSPSCTSPLLVLCNSKSGDNQGVKFLRKFKQLLNPAQVFDLMNGGPQLGLRVFQKFATFRILVCGGDGSVGWVLSELDKLNLHKQCQLGVLPLGTGNDLARVLGWGGLCDDDAQLLQILEKLERATTKMLDSQNDTTVSHNAQAFLMKLSYLSPQVHITQYADSVASHLTKILDSDKHTDVISSAKYVGFTVLTEKQEAYRLLISAQYNSRIDIGEYLCSLCCVYLCSQCSEKCVMNNYFGIGLDAKISLEFNNKRDEHPKKCSSRTKNKLWYGVMGTKELVHKTYKNLEQRVLLECDGVPMCLPSLQGLAVLNIPSYAGGINFWGGTKEDNNFGAPSFDDKKLEVVAVFGSMQMAVSRVINIQHHRIAQCRQVKITILGEEGVPVQVDGEAWIQPPGIVKITHKNRAQMLTRDRVRLCLGGCECVWIGKLLFQAISDTTNSIDQIIVWFVELSVIREAAKTHKLVEQELAHAVNASAMVLTEAFPSKPSSPEVRQLHYPALEWYRLECIKHIDSMCLIPFHPLLCARPPPSSLFWNVNFQCRCVFFLYIYMCVSLRWSVCVRVSVSVAIAERWESEEVAAWLYSLGLGEYRDTFLSRDIQGCQLSQLQRHDLKVQEDHRKLGAHFGYRTRQPFWV